MTDEEFKAMIQEEDKTFLTKMKNAMKEFDFICDKKEGINCDGCPLNITKESNLGRFEFCLRWGLLSSVKDWKKYMNERYKKPSYFFYVQFHENQGKPFFMMFYRIEDKSSIGLKGWCKSINNAVKKCFENEVTNPFLISIEELAANFTLQFTEKETSCERGVYFVNL